MKKLYLYFLMTAFLSASLIAQPPKLINYQASIRDKSGRIIMSREVSLRISIIKDNPNGIAVYTELHNVVTSWNGIVNLQIGNGSTTDDLASIDWSSGLYFLKVEVDIKGRNNFISLGTSQFLSVPYALYAERSGNANETWNKDGNNLYYNEGNVGIGKERLGNIYNPKFFVYNGWLQVTDSSNHDAGIVISHQNRTGYGYARSVHQVFEGVNGDPFTEFRIRKTSDNSSVTSWTIGADNSDDDKLKINLYNNVETGSSPSYGNNFMTITQAGNIGIGTSDPVTLLNIVGNVDEGDRRAFIRLKNTSSGPKAQTALSLNSFENKGATFGFESSTYSMNDLSDFGFLTTNGRGFALMAPTSNGQIRFYTNINTEGPSERMRINENGNVGIGTLNPKTKLEIAEGDIYIKDINKGIIMTSPDGQCWRGTINNSGQLEFSAITCP